MEKLKRPIFIIGARRSGTTLLRTILEGHPDLLVHPQEPQFFLDVYRRFGKQITKVPEALDLIVNHPYCAKPVTQVRLYHTFQGRKSVSLEELVQEYIKLWGGEQLNHLRPVLKHPALIFHLGLIFEIFPEACMIHIVRDPRANVSSQRARWKKATIWECILWWRDAVTIGHKLVQERPNQCIEITYEALVKTPEETAQRLCDFLHLSYSAKLLEFELKTRSFAPGSETKQNTFTRPDPSRLDLWKNQLSLLEIQMIENACARQMAFWGYPTTHHRVSSFAVKGRTLFEQTHYALLSMGRYLKKTHGR